jgi:prepilin-type N-terminal cleavage/methylation domain-containing protein
VTAPARSEQGSTLIEVLVSVVILGLAATAFLLGISTTIGTSSLSRDQATAETFLTSAGEVMRDGNFSPYSCNVSDYNNDLVSYLSPVPTGGWIVNVTRLRYLDPSGGWLGTCPTSLQGITVTVQSPDHQVTMSREFTKAAPL